MRRLRFTGMVAGHFPDLYPGDPKPLGARARIPDRTARPTKPFHEANQANGSFAGRLGGHWIYT